MPPPLSCGGSWGFVTPGCQHCSVARGSAGRLAFVRREVHTLSPETDVLSLGLRATLEGLGNKVDISTAPCPRPRKP